MSEFFVPIAVVLLVLFLASMFCCGTCKARGTTRSQISLRLSAAEIQAQAQAQAQAHNQVQESKKGLDQESIDLYPTVVIGESGRMITADENTCPICLSEYLPNDVLMILPECVHRFHAECLDEWLRVNATCPVCRLHPPISSSSNV